MTSVGRVGILLCALILGDPRTGPIDSTRATQADKPPETKHVDVFQPLGVRTKVAFIKPEGSWVDRGGTVCTLDSGTIRERLAGQVLAIEEAATAHEKTLHDLQVAEIAAAEYAEVTFNRQWIDAERRVRELEAELDRARSDSAWVDRIERKGYLLFIKRSSSIRAKVLQVTFALEQARTGQAVLEKFTREKTTRELEREVEKARSIEAAARVALEREQAIGDALSKQVANCTVNAPVEGRVRYLWPIEAGATVREGDILFRIVVEGR
jgi:HlyD family secretion protein